MNLFQICDEATRGNINGEGSYCIMEPTILATELKFLYTSYKVYLLDKTWADEQRVTTDTTVKSQK
jgi:hypothetical protein